MFLLFNFSSIFLGGPADPICPYVRTPMHFVIHWLPPLVVCAILYRQRTRFQARAVSGRRKMKLRACRLSVVVEKMA